MRARPSPNTGHVLVRGQGGHVVKRSRDEMGRTDIKFMDVIRLAVERCQRNGRHSGLCGRAPSDYPEFADFLIHLGIDSISLNPDVIVPTTLRNPETEADGPGMRS
jgi:phosphoenolpyruvate synthase/pyruvate phosphate dikinase